MSNKIDTYRRRSVLAAIGTGSAAALAGCSSDGNGGGGSGGSGDDGPSLEGDVDSEIDGVSVSNVGVEETEYMGTDAIAVTATATNETEEPIEVRTEGSFYDADGAELDTMDGCEEIDAETDYNGQMIVTDRVDAADSYEVTLVENEDLTC